MYLCSDLVNGFCNQWAEVSGYTLTGSDPILANPSSLGFADMFEAMAIGLSLTISIGLLTYGAAFVRNMLKVSL